MALFLWRGFGERHPERERQAQARRGDLPPPRLHQQQGREEGGYSAFTPRQLLILSRNFLTAVVVGVVLRYRIPAVVTYFDQGPNQADRRAHISQLQQENAATERQNRPWWVTITMFANRHVATLYLMSRRHPYVVSITGGLHRLTVYQAHEENTAPGRLDHSNLGFSRKGKPAQPQRRNYKTAEEPTSTRHKADR